MGIPLEFQERKHQPFPMGQPSEKAPPQETVDVVFLGFRHSKRLAASFMPFQIDTEENLSRRREHRQMPLKAPSCVVILYITI